MIGQVVTITEGTHKGRRGIVVYQDDKALGIVLHGSADGTSVFETFPVEMTSAYQPEDKKEQE